MPKYKWDITRKSDGKVTHIVYSEVKPVHMWCWGEEGSYDLVQGPDMLPVYEYSEKKLKQEAAIKESIGELLEAILEAFKDSQNPKLKEASERLAKIKQDYPVPSKPGGAK